jgi:hypothetical protein
MAKQITPVTIWVNGENKIAEYLQVIGINDNYQSSATNYWSLYTKVVDENGVESMGMQISQGNLIIDGENYVLWGDQPAMAINEWIYNWSAEQLNLTII